VVDICQKSNAKTFERSRQAEHRQRDFRGADLVALVRSPVNGCSAESGEPGGSQPLIAARRLSSIAGL
jgi:hypothetical protein